MTTSKMSGCHSSTADTVSDDEVTEEYGVVDLEGNLLVVVHVASSNQYELHPIPYSGSYNDKLVGDWTTDDIDTFVVVYKGEGDGTLWWPKLSNSEARPVRIVTELNPRGPVCKKVEYHLLELTGAKRVSIRYDTDHLTSIPGMVDSIKEGMATPVEECSTSIWPDSNRIHTTQSLNNVVREGMGLPQEDGDHWMYWYP